MTVLSLPGLDASVVICAGRRQAVVYIGVGVSSAVEIVTDSGGGVTMDKTVDVHDVKEDKVLDGQAIMRVQRTQV